MICVLGLAISAEAQAQTPEAAPKRGSPVVVAEGVVTKIERAGKSVDGELQRFVFDPTQDWDAYMTKGVTKEVTPSSGTPKTPAIPETKEKEDVADAPKASLLDMAITKRTYVYTHARDADGTDQYGSSTSASPAGASSKAALTKKSADAADERPQRTNFTNLKEGSFVSVRYRKVGEVNEVLNLTIIELPLNAEAPPIPSVNERPSPATGTPKGANR